MAAGGSAQSRAEELRARAAQARAQAEALEAQAGAWAAGADGERRVAAALHALPPTWHVHHDRLLRPGRAQTNLDHVVIGPSGVYLVDTKNWAGGTSVHEGNLWQHASSSSAKGRELDSVARFAGEMERTLGLPVVPVIALAGGHSASFPSQRVRGVEIIPVSGLIAWLQAQSKTSGTEDAEVIARRVAHTYPCASTEPAGADLDVLTVADVLAAGQSTARRAPSPVPRGSSRPRGRQGARRRPRRRGSMLAGLVGLLALWAFSQVGPHIITSLMAPPGISSASSSARAGTTPLAPKPCLALHRASIQKVTGATTALEKPSSSNDICMWWLSKPRYSTDGSDVTVEMGRVVEVRFAVSGTTSARTDMSPGGASAWLPRNTSLPGWKSGLRTSQPFMISYRFSYPEGASEATARAVEATAEKKVARLAEELARALSARSGN
ncbi:nuclease-related domain-containing protein [Terracoccus sp. 273MFTsu3.1]|uniref:nuclease-related domain-containing protein n=1 Tax=Terracoccus sp. 273MFTsu3.1 TaxID=1172188 RepID=UPI0003826A4C|nr:nuclease-related domain-containing protein [Terracoccus sp. 273MFTsu3.1]